MAKTFHLSIVVAVLLLLFSGTMVKETNAQHMCHENLTKTTCEEATCRSMCTQKWKGTGTCVQTYEQRYACVCTWPCKSI
ncbi:PREDICTED: putative defensin-like protein 128 [Tarenaya hassleriana]|uniref:putative defensin-like protein 128 n=1 Tax=Tarenaya hassleriana TaxID=28532 RepID=UPI0008FD82E4|nr:PREDICTED: putative defensin-like protein 128 [Tarenaya hassleriana]